MTVQQPVAPPLEQGAPAGAARAMADAKVAVAAFIVVIGVVAYAMFGTIAEIVATWNDSVTFNHGFLIVPICLYLAWRRRQEIAVAPLNLEWRGLLLVFLAAAGWLLGAISGTVVVQQVAAVALVQAMVLTMFGWRLTRLLRFPLLYLYFAVPFGLALVPPLQEFTAHLSIDLLRLVGIPVFVDGNMISTPTGNFLVAEACSGIRYLIASIALGVLLSGLMYRSWWRRAFFLFLSVAVPVVANGIRAFGIILIAYLTNNEYATGIDHIFYGWVFFTLVTFVLLAIGMAMSQPDEAVSPAPAPSNKRNLSVRSVIAAGLLVVAAVWAAKAYAEFVNRPFTIVTRTLGSPVVAQPWQAATGTQDPLQPKFFGADAQVDRVYRAGGRPVYLHVGYYAQQRHGSEAVSSLHRLTRTGEEIPNATGQVKVVLGGADLAVNFARFPAFRGGRLIWYWYWVDGKFVGSPYLAKLLQLKAKLLRGSQSAAIIMIAADFDELPDEAEKQLRNFLPQTEALLPVLEAAGQK
ncbi:MAG TPA: exosortase A [Candidatus Sulfotelmatobacter sp.]|nr:exosortase A [Candidatus Sulfotelmatobacter sp.]